MKKLLIFAAVATMFAACSKDATQDLAAAKPIDKFYATIADNDSRVQLNDACRTVWTAGDRVSVFNKTTGNRRYKFTGNTGDTTGELSYMNGGTTGSAIDKVIAIYPYNISNTVSTDGTITTVVPTTQTYCKDSFGIGSCIMVAHSESEKLSFHNVVGWIRIALTGNKVVKSIILYGYNKEPLAGTATIANDLSIKFGSNATTSVTLDCGEGVQLSAEPTYFYIAVAPQTFSKGYCVEIVDTENKVASLATHKSVTIERNHILPMTEAEYNNPQVKPISNQIWYTTSDGKTITPQSYDGAIVSNTYSNGKGIITFDCVQKKIGSKAFYDCESLTSITIPDSVTSIGGSAFSGCTDLTSITIPDSVTSIGWSALSGCTGLTSVTIPNSVTSIGEHAFSSCTGLKSVTISNSVTSIGNEAFSSCTSLTSVTIPDSVTSIGESAFSGCTGLTSVTIPDSVNSIGRSAFSSCTGLKSVTIPNSVNEISDYAFWRCTGLTGATIPDSVTSIGWHAFQDCTGLTSVTIPNSVTSIGDYAFQDCTGLTSVYISDLAAWCSIKFFDNVSNPLRYAHNLYLNGNLITELVIPDSVTEIGNYAFYWCTGLTSVTIPNSVTSIGEYAFQDCTGLTSVTIPNSVTSIGEYAFQDCTGLTSVYISDLAAWCSIKFESYSYRYSGINNPLYYAHNLYLNGNLITELVIPDSVTEIGNWAFFGYKGLKSVIIPDSVTKIGSYAFRDCTGLTSVTIPDSITSIGKNVFYHCTGLTSVTIPDSVTSIGESAFCGCTGLTSVTIPDSVKEIGSYTFYNCSKLTSVTIPDSVTSIGERAFYGCTGLTSVTIPNSVTYIGSYAFYGCTGLTSVTIPDSVKEIGKSAFQNCTNLKSVYCKPTTPPTLESNVFDEIASSAIIYVPYASVDKYKSAYRWGNYSSKIQGYNF